MVSRHLQILRLWMIKSPMKRAAYLREKETFRSIGERVMITSRKIPLYAKLISIGNNVWIGAGSTILAGVEIGDNSVIGAGSVVTKSIPSNVVAVGVPCKVLREISEKDKTSYPFHTPN